MVAAVIAPSTAATAGHPGPPLSVPEEKLRAALHCATGMGERDGEPVLLVHGISTSAEESWGGGYRDRDHADPRPVQRADHVRSLGHERRAPRHRRPRADAHHAVDGAALVARDDDVPTARR
jgi:hypothetical protein